MKKILLLFLLTLSLPLFAEGNRFWNNDKNYMEILTVDSGLFYSPSVVNFTYGLRNVFETLRDLREIGENNDNGYYFSDTLQFQNLYNIYPVFQTGMIMNYKWLWGLQTFVFNNYYRICGFSFDVYNLTFQISTMDMGFAWYKYNWYTHKTYYNVVSFLISPITVGIMYRIKINETVETFINIGYNIQVIFGNRIWFPDDDKTVASMFGEHNFIAGLGFRFHTNKFVK